ncbi:branched-chain amino acid ABC transporter permease, partial [Streptomyces sp. TRM76130]|nr:branched-chain amino acid ABC transporter permease [Streptomyces sp. TRM76130]
GVKGLRPLTPAGADPAVRFAALAAFATTWYTVIAISAQLGGVVNLEPGGWIAAAVTLVALLGALALPFERPAPDPVDPDDSGWERFRHRTARTWGIVKAAFTGGTP